MKLSAYTEAKNCTDITDLKGGIEDIENAIAICKSQNKKIPSYFYVRLSKLERKLIKFQNQCTPTISATVRFRLDIETLEQAVRHCLLYKNEPTKQKVISTIKAHVLQHGRDIIDFPEYWGEELQKVDRNEVEKHLSSLSFEFGLKNWTMSENEEKGRLQNEIQEIKAGDKVIVSPVATGLGNDLIGYVSKVETFLGRVLVSVDYISPDPMGGRGTCVNACHVTKIE